MPFFVRCDMYHSCLSWLEPTRTPNPVNREESAALKTSLVFPLQLDPKYCYKLHFTYREDDFYWIDRSYFEVLHNPTRCRQTDVKLTPSPNSFNSMNECMSFGFVHFTPNFPTKTCDCLVVLIVHGHNDKEGFKEKLFFNSHFSA